MTGTDFLNLDDVVPNMAEGYIPIKDENDQLVGWKKNYYAATAGPAADGGATSTLDDLARFSRSLRDGRLVSLELVRAMSSPQVVENNDGYRGYQWMYGFGCFVLLDGAGRTVRWGLPGEEEGISCRLWHYPQQDVDVVILGNQSSCAAEIAWDIHDLLYTS